MCESGSQLPNNGGPPPEPNSLTLLLRGKRGLRISRAGGRGRDSPSGAWTKLQHKRTKAGKHTLQYTAHNSPRKYDQTEKNK